MSIFEQASYFTLDKKMKELLINCSKNIFPPEFKVSNGKIITKNVYPIPSDPMNLYNLVHDIMSGTEPAQKMAASSVAPRKVTICEDSIDMYAKRMGTSPHHSAKIISCIYTALYMGYINERDFIYDGSLIRNIKRIDVTGPTILHK